MGRYRAPRAMTARHGGARIEDVAAELGLSRERVRQIENAALEKARTLLAERGLTLAHFLGALERDRPDCPVEQEW